MEKIKNALISVYHKENLEKILQKLHELNIKIYSTGGTYDYIKKLGIPVTTVESLTSYPSILGGRVKTLHPLIFGGILFRRENETDAQQVKEYGIPEMDLVIVDLYPFEETLANTRDENEIIEKIDIGGISLIRAAAKNFNDVVIIGSSDKYPDLLDMLEEKNGHSELEDRKKFAAYAFNITSHYDTAIFNYFNESARIDVFKKSITQSKLLRYGENPHQAGTYFGKLGDIFDQLHGKEISYNNLLDIDASVQLISEFDETTFAVLKHNNACGLACRPTLLEAWNAALAGDPISAFGGVLVTNRRLDKSTAIEINNIFFEVIIAPEYDDDAIEILKSKKNRIILVQKQFDFPETNYKSVLNGVLVQEKDIKSEEIHHLSLSTNCHASESELQDLVFANKIVKHTKSNAIVIAKNLQLYAAGTGQTSRVDAMRQAIKKAREFEKDLNGAVLASDAFFPFPDNVEIAHNAGITAIVQPGGSIKDQDSIDYCNEHNISMYFTGIRHFKH